MLLVCDVGNTNLVFGVFNGEKLISDFRIGTDTKKTSDEYGILVKSMLEQDNIRITDINDVIISSVVPEVMHSLENFSLKYCGKNPYLVGHGLKTGINIKYQNPAQVGADRIVNAVGSLALYKGPMVIVDFGTATTFCAVTENADYLGGAIAPGPKISAEALFVKTSMLPNIEIVKPEAAIGKNTIWAMQSGIYYGYVGLVDNIVDKIMEEIRRYEKNEEKEIKVIATGGLSSLIVPGSKHKIIINKNLTLEGLRFIYEKNC